jgi:hypothetical protein
VNAVGQAPEAQAALAAATEKLPFLERLGVQYLNSISAGLPAVTMAAEDPVHVLNTTERAALSRIMRNGTLKGLAAGAAAGLGGAIVEMLVETDVIPTFGLPSWAAIGAITVFVTALEIGYLYKVCLDCVHALAREAGVHLGEHSDKHMERQVTARALARAALELPNPIEPRFGVNPRGETSKTWLVVVTLLYKAKVGLTNFIFKAIFRRILGRFGLRYAAALVAVPVVAVWDAVVCWKVLWEARIRVLGPSAAREFASGLLDPPPDLSPEGRRVVVGAVAACVLRKADMHPNLLAFLREIVERVGPPESEVEHSTAAFLDALTKLPPHEQKVALQVVCASAALDGKLRRRERDLINASFGAVGKEPPIETVKQITKALSQGDAISFELLQKLV